MKFSLLAGVDEAGRGPLAGPVVAAAVILPPRFPVSGLKDSKRLSKIERNRFYGLIIKKAVGVGIGLVDAEEIDRINILQATFKAMHLAVMNLPSMPGKLIIDGNRIVPTLSIPQKSVIQGDLKIHSIMCAAIVAKVTRDQLMEEKHREYPEYGFFHNKGYGTKTHLEALQRYGPSPIHRKSFAPVREALVGSFCQQLSLV